MPRPNRSDFTRAVEFIESGAPELVAEFLTHARSVALRRGLIALRKARATRPAGGVTPVQSQPVAEERTRDTA